MKKSRFASLLYSVNKQGTYETNNYNVETLNYAFWTYFGVFVPTHAPTHAPTLPHLKEKTLSLQT